MNLEHKQNIAFGTKRKLRKLTNTTFKYPVNDSTSVTDILYISLTSDI